MNENTSRISLYGVGVVALSGLLYAGFVYEAEPDPGTLLGGINVQLRLAHGMPELDDQGARFAPRESLLEEAATNLRRVRLQLPNSPVVEEFSGFLLHLRGDYRGAARHYQLARSLPGCLAEQRDTLVFNEARMLAASGDHEAALAVFTANADRLQPHYAAQRKIEEAGLLREMGRSEDALARLEEVAGSEQPVAWLQAGQEYERLGHVDDAAVMFDKASARVPLAEYHLARLKLASGDVDSSLRLLERAASTIPAEVHRLIQKDELAWRAVAEDERFQELTASGEAAPGR